MYIIIGGGGLIGKGLATQLVAQRHDVVVIEKDPETCEDIYATTGAVTVNGSATDLSILESAGIDKCDVVVAAMRGDSDNLSFALLAKHHDVEQVIVRMNDPKYEAVYKTVGVHNIARSQELLIEQIMVNIESPELRKVISLGEIEICIFDIPEKAECLGKTISEIANTTGFPRRLIVAAMYDESTQTFIVPRGDTVLNAKDRLFLCGSLSDIKAATKFLD